MAGTRKNLWRRMGSEGNNCGSCPLTTITPSSTPRWMGHVLRRDKDEPVKRVWNLEIAGKRERGRPKMTWKDMVKKESRKIGLDERDAQDRKKWRTGIATWKE